jgi:hypothetical protein
MNYSILFNPIATPITIAAIASLAVLVVTTKHRRSIAAMLVQTGQRLFSRSGFFWTVNIVFMAVSVLHAGVFFGITGNGHDLPGAAAYLGFAVSFFLDLVTVILMQAMLESRYRGENGRARQFLFFITVCCGTSTFANLAISLNDFDAPRMLPHAPFWVQAAAPYVLASFPLFVIMMSIAAEMIVNLRPLESLDVEEYEADEEKRIAILQIRNTYLEKQAAEELRALEIRAAMQSNKSVYRPRISWPRFGGKAVDTEAMIMQITEQLQEHYNEQIAALSEQINILKNTPITTPDLALHALPILSSMSTNEHQNEQCFAPIDLDSRRSNEQRNTEDLAPRSAQKGDSDVLKKVRRIVSKNREITALELAQKIGKSRAQAGRLKAKILAEQGAPEPA